MSTRAYIAKKLEDGTYKYIYCHYDGYVEYTGAILQEYYSDEADVDELLSLGSISVLDKYVGGEYGIRKDDEEFNRVYRKSMQQCVAYHRDMGREFEVFTADECSCFKGEQDFTYLWSCDTKSWYVAEGDGKFRLLKGALDSINNTTAHSLKVKDVVKLISPNTCYIITFKDTNKIVYDSSKSESNNYLDHVVRSIQPIQISEQTKPYISYIQAAICLVIIDETQG